MRCVPCKYEVPLTAVINPLHALGEECLSVQCFASMSPVHLHGMVGTRATLNPPYIWPLLWLIINLQFGLSVPYTNYSQLLQASESVSAQFPLGGGWHLLKLKPMTWTPTVLCKLQSKALHTLFSWQFNKINNTRKNFWCFKCILIMNTKRQTVVPSPVKCI
jgi:hypothetical protein